MCFYVLWVGRKKGTISPSFYAEEEARYLALSLLQLLNASPKCADSRNVILETHEWTLLSIRGNKVPALGGPQMQYMPIFFLHSRCKFKCPAVQMFVPFGPFVQKFWLITH